MSQQAIVLQHTERITKFWHFYSLVKTHSNLPQLQKYALRQLLHWSVLYRQDFDLLLSKQVGAGEIDDLVSPSVQDRLDHVEVKIDDLVQFEAWGHSQFLTVHGNIHQSGTVVREGLFESGPNLLRVINVQPKNSRSLRNLGKIRIDQFRGMVEESGRLHLQLHKVQRPVVEHDDLHGEIQLPERQQVAHQHGDAPIA